MAFDSGNTYQGIQCTAMTDNAAAAAEGASKLCQAIEESGEVALIVQDSVSGNARQRAEAFRSEVENSHPGVSVVETIYMDQLDDLKQQAAAEKLGVTAEELETWINEASGVSDGEDGSSQDTEDGEEGGTISEAARTRLEDINSIAEDMSDEDAVVYYLEKHPELNGCLEQMRMRLCCCKCCGSDGKSEEITVMGLTPAAS